MGRTVFLSKKPKAALYQQSSIVKLHALIIKASMANDLTIKR